MSFGFGGYGGGSPSFFGGFQSAGQPAAGPAPTTPSTASTGSMPPPMRPTGIQLGPDSGATGGALQPTAVGSPGPKPGRLGLNPDAMQVGGPMQPPRMDGGMPGPLSAGPPPASPAGGAMQSAAFGTPPMRRATAAYGASPMSTNSRGKGF